MRALTTISLAAVAFVLIFATGRVAAGSPSGQVIVLKASGGPLGLYGADAATGVCRELLSLPRDVNEVFVSPDGRDVAYRRWADVGGPTALVVTTVEGTLRRVIATRALDIQGWANGHQLIYSELVNGRRMMTIARADDSSGIPARLSWPLSKRFGWPLSLSPDGRYVTFTAEMGGLNGLALNIMRTDGRERHELWRGAGSTPIDVSWSPDATKIVSGGQIYTIKTDGRGHWQLLPRTLAGLIGAPFSWSPDGSKLLFTGYHLANGRRSSDAYILKSDGGRPRRLTFTNDTTAGPWSPDGQAVALNRDKRVDIVGLNGADRRTICAGSAALAWQT